MHSERARLRRMYTICTSDYIMRKSYLERRKDALAKEGKDFSRADAWLIRIERMDRFSKHLQNVLWDLGVIV